VAASVAQAIDLLRGIGCEVREVEQPYAHEAVQALLGILYPEASAFHLRWLRERPEDYAVNMRERLELGALLPGRILVRALRARQTVSQSYQRLLSDVDILVTPAAPFPSYRLDETPADPVTQAGERMAGLITFSGPFDLTGLPAISVPVAKSDEGLPIGVQLVGKAFGEQLLYQVAHAIEQAAIGWRQRPESSDYVV
jgi:aspartyl-tRNA(Asn)/glutamyl-tRNA(Gln) amidotransferase subunit A